jgi:hypothetical protein
MIVFRRLRSSASTSSSAYHSSLLLQRSNYSSTIRCSGSRFLIPNYHNTTTNHRIPLYGISVLSNQFAVNGRRRPSQRSIVLFSTTNATNPINSSDNNNGDLSQYNTKLRNIGISAHIDRYVFCCRSCRFRLFLLLLLLLLCFGWY